MSRVERAQVDAATARGWVLGLLAREATRREALALAVHEVVVNALEHGAADGAVAVEAERRDDAVTVRVCEPASGAPARPSGARAEPEAPRGRGLTLVAACCDDWQVSEADGQRTTALTVRTGAR